MRTNYKEILEIIRQSTLDTSKKDVARPIDKLLWENIYSERPVTVLSGIRRAGKSFILKKIYGRLIDEGYPKENLLFINFENDLIYDRLDLKLLREIYEIFISHSDLSKPLYLFLDEVQEVRAWEKFVRTIYDSTQHRIFVTGSNSQLLSNEFSTALGGRILEYEVYPFSLGEFLTYHNLEVKNVSEIIENKHLLDKLTRKYINFGGISEAFELSEEEKIVYRKSLLEKIAFNDIVKRYELDQPEILMKLISYFSKTAGRPYNASTIAQHLKTTDKTVDKYVGYLENAYILRTVSKFSWKAKSILNSQQKVYFHDNLLITNPSFGDKYENMIYTELIKMGHQNISFARDSRGKEVDFFVDKRGNLTQVGSDNNLAIQACVELNDENVDREIGNFNLFLKYMGAKDNDTALVYLYDRRNEKTSIPEIKTISFLEWALGIESVE